MPFRLGELIKTSGQHSPGTLWRQTRTSNRQHWLHRFDRVEYMAIGAAVHVKDEVQIEIDVEVKASAATPEVVMQQRSGGSDIITVEEGRGSGGTYHMN
jgi:hypothetical protein